MNTQAHWQHVYTTKNADGVSWYQVRPALSLDLIAATGTGYDAAIIDVGAGASTLIDHLLDTGYRDLTVLDIAQTALDTARLRLGARAEEVCWRVGDITTAALEQHRYDVWHDRAVFHFLTEPADRQRYVAQVLRAVRPGGHVIIATFAPDGPAQCSGLPTARYDAAALHSIFGPAFTLVQSAHEAHTTPWGIEQRFVYCRCQKMEPVPCSPI
jgi:SAM-dependent methyltransferase